MTEVEYPRWMFRLGTADCPVDAVLVADEDEAKLVGDGWSRDRTELLKGTGNEGARITERHLQLHQVMNEQKANEPTEEPEVSTNA